MEKQRKKEREISAAGGGLKIRQVAHELREGSRRRHGGRGKEVAGARDKGVGVVGLWLPVSAAVASPAAAAAAA